MTEAILTVFIELTYIYFTNIMYGRTISTVKLLKPGAYPQPAASQLWVHSGFLKAFW